MRPISRAVIDRIVNSAYNSLQSTVGIAKLSASTPPPNRYGEIMFLEYDMPINFVAHATPEPAEIKLNELGWQKDDVNMMVRVPHKELRRVGLAKETGELNFDSDARLVVQGLEYEISKIHMKEPFLENISVYVWIGGRTPNGRKSPT